MTVAISHHKTLDPNKKAGLSYPAAGVVLTEQQGSTGRSGVSVHSCLKPGVRKKSVSEVNKGSLYVF